MKYAEPAVIIHRRNMFLERPDVFILTGFPVNIRSFGDTVSVGALAQYRLQNY